MTKDTSKKTVWNNGKDEWTQVFENVQITEEMEEALDLALREYSTNEPNKKRIEEFSTPINPDSMTQSVG